HNVCSLRTKGRNSTSCGCDWRAACTRILEMADIARIEELMRDLEDYTSDTPEFLMRDHLEAMRLYILNSMPEEYNLTLKLARNLLPAIQDGRFKQRLTEVLESPVAAF